MPVGVRIRGDHGLVQIDENYLCQTVAAHGTLASASKGAIYEIDDGLDRYTITYTGHVPMFGLYVPPSEQAVGCVLSTSKSGNVWTCHFAVNQKTGVPGVVNPNNVHWFVFDRPAPITGPGAGLRVWNAGGELIYHSDWRTCTPTRNFQPGRKYAGVGGAGGFTRYFSLDLHTDMTWWHAIDVFASGFECPNGGLDEKSIQVVARYERGLGGGADTVNYYGVTGPLFGVDVTDFL